MCVYIYIYYVCMCKNVRMYARLYVCVFMYMYVCVCIINKLVLFFVRCSMKYIIGLSVTLNYPCTSVRPEDGF